MTTVTALALAACAAPPPPPEVPAPRAAVTEDSISITTPSGEVFGTLMQPAGRFPFPVALIIAGSGPTDRNGNSAALPGHNNSLKLLAEGLAARGIATVRFDKRGVGQSRAALTGEEDLRFNMFIEDAVLWIQKLRADERFSTVTVIGHSEGSLIGMVAADTGRADAFVSIAGVGRKAQDLLITQLGAQLPPDVVSQAQRVVESLAAGRTPDSVPPVLSALFRPSVQGYLISWFRYDPIAEIAKLSVPALVVQGSTDVQVSVEDARLLAAAYPASRLVIIEGMNHVLKEAAGGRLEQQSVYSDPSLPVVPGLIDEIATFIRSVVRQPEARTTQLGNGNGSAHRVQYLSDGWTGPDKVMHFFMTAFVQSLSFGVMQLAGADRDAAFAGSTAAAAAASIGKEIHDRRSRGVFSVADLAWDAAGAASAISLLRKTGDKP